MLVLDVGCGDNPKGNINVDICIGWSPQTGNQKDKLAFINPRMIKNFVLASGEFLPFQSDCFERVVSFEVIEHANNPMQFLHELIRVSKSEIVVSTPHRYSISAKMPFHKHFFTRSWFVQACKKENVKIKSVKITYTYPFDFGIVKLPLARIHRMFFTIKKYSS